MKIKYCFFLLLSVVFIFTACETEKEPIPPQTCDSMNPVTYTNAIKSIINNNCLGCHNAGNTNPNLDTYAKVILVTDKLMLAIHHKSGALPMPQGGAKLDAATLKKFDCWKEQGFKE